MLVAVAVAIIAFVGITAATGLPAPGPFQRYPVSTLDDLVHAIHAEAGPLRTPDDCWKTYYRHGSAPKGPDRPIAAVDWLRSRVVVRERSDLAGNVSWSTSLAVHSRLAQIVEDDPRFSWRMIEVEPSPDGWSPTMSCSPFVRSF